MNRLLMLYRGCKVTLALLLTLLAGRLDKRHASSIATA